MANVRRQSTLRAPAVCAGISLHGGRQTRLVMNPAAPNTGLVFRRSDIKDRYNLIPVQPELVTGVQNCTTISNAANVTVSTIEHLLAALCAAGVDNLLIDLDGPELPALDGSAEPFLKLIEQVGLYRQAAPRRYIRVLKTVEISAGDASAKVEPCERFELDVTIDFDDAAIGRQRLQIVPDVRAFRDRLASARTFARKHEVAALQEAGLSKGGSFDNAILVDGDEVLNPGGLRFDDEFVRHKALDLMGDMYLGGPILGRVTTNKSGHGLNHDLLTKIFATKDAWEFAVLPGARALIAVVGEKNRPNLMPRPAIAVSA
ncbi:UDP-3-O-acyl-N-acetylglucosamine deacetylase [Algimonas arctica]|uniref:UDP-3-O-acyl-N-acetylglucosamine deacetylase n=1 Tax=Algimonas arctica TaxID=1479486 RepID=A0A8J3G172_9PROT|nr:UDP-3-O-acyl-N-acetylglucosamine deacetylase [Algimonas arctica]GHA82605.1 UDP-3-O-acyl-N-acetylglucosamine deacetylase [Algimonas arctica]